MSFPFCMVGTETIPSRTWMPGTVTTNSFRRFFLSLRLFPQRHVLINSLLNAWEKLSRFPSSVSVQLSLLWYPKCSSHFGFPGLSVLSPQLTESAKFHGGIVFCAIAWKPSQGSKLGGNCGFTLFVSIFSRIIVFVAWYPVSWELLFHIFNLVYLNCFRQEDKPSLYYSILFGSENFHLL